MSETPRLLKETENYRAYPALNQSKLKKLDSENPSDFLAEDSESTAPWMINGSMVDCYVTEGKDAFKEKYAALGMYPSESIRVIIDAYYESMAIDGAHEEAEPLGSDNLILSMCAKFEFQKRWKDETKVTHIREKGLDYAKFLIMATGKIVVNIEDYNNACDLSEKILTDVYTQHIFESHSLEKKVSGLFTYRDRLCKVEIDMLDDFGVEDGNICINLYDIKTTSGSLALDSFTKSIEAYGYDVQMAFYSEFLKAYYANKYPEATSIQIIPIIVAGAFKSNTVRVYRFSSEIIAQGKQKMESLFDKLDYHELEGFEYPMEYSEAQGVYTVVPSQNKG